MTIYFILLIIVIITVRQAQKSTGRLMPALMYFIALASMVFVGALRSRYVGTDSGYYVLYFEDTQSLSDVFIRPEFGYFFLCWLAHFLSDNYISIFFLVTLLVASCFMWGIYQYSINPALSFFVLLTAGAFFVHFNGARQGLANAIYFLAIGALLNKKFKQYLCYVGVAYLFHKSVIVTLPAYFLLTKKNTLKFNLIIAVLGSAGALFFERFVDLGATIDQRYEKYVTKVTEGFGINMMLFFCVLSLFFLLIKNRIVVNRDKYDTMLNMFLLATTISIVSVVTETGGSGIARLNMYFSMSAILMWPIINQNILEIKEKTLFCYCLVTGYLLYYGLTLRAFGRMVPFSWNPVVADWFTL